MLSGRVSVWLPVHSCQVRLPFKAAVLSWLLAGRTRPAPALFLESRFCRLCVLSLFQQMCSTLVQSCYLFVPHHLEAALCGSGF